MSHDSTAKYLCRKCGIAYPRTGEFFHKNKNSKDGFWRYCKECNNQKSRQWASENSARAVERVRQWRIQNPEKLQEYHERTFEERMAKKRAWRQANPELVRQHKSASQKRNRQSADRRGRRWRHKNIERANEMSRAAYYRRKERIGSTFIAAANHKRRARKLQNGGTHDASDILRRHETQQERCFYCGITLHGDYHVDHYIPLAQGGSNGHENIVIACPDCNLSKNDKLPEVWAADRDW